MRRQEYNTVVDMHANNLFGYALSFLHDREDAEDIVQDVFEKLWVNRRKVDPAKAKSWMFTTAHNAMINFSNRKKRLSFSDHMETYEKGEVSPGSFESNQVVNRAVNILPPVQKSIILLRDIEGYSYKEIGDILDVSESQVKVYLFRARRKIKKQLKGLVELV